MKLLFTSILYALLALHSYGQGDCPPAESKAEKKYDKGTEAMDKGDKQEALALWKESIDIDDEYAAPRYTLGKYYYEKGNYYKAGPHLLVVLENCIEAFPEAYFMLGDIAFQQSDFGVASDYFFEYLNSDGNDPAFIEMAEELSEYSADLDEIMSNPVPFNPKPIPGLNSNADEYLAALSPDNDIMLFTRRSQKTVNSHLGSQVKQVEEFTLSEKVDGRFGLGNAMLYPFNQGLNEGGGALTIDNTYLFVTICNTPEGFGSCDIFVSEFRNGQWGELENLGSNVNDSMWQSQVTVSRDGKTVYFSSNRLDGYGGKDIWKTTRVQGGWSDPENLGPVINTSGDEKSPFIHPDDNTLYFSSTGHAGLGGFDIFFSRRDDDGEWNRPANIGYPINSQSDDLGFFASTNGKTGYFASNKISKNGGWDIYSFPLYEKARPKKVLFVKGEIKDEHGNVMKDVSLELRDLKTNEVEKIEVDSSTGRYVLAQVATNEKMLTVNKEGYFYGSQLIVPDSGTFESPATIDFQMGELEVGKSFKLQNILFDTDSYELKSESFKELDNIYEFLQYNLSVRIEIAGHTDDVGDPSSNKDLSMNRAKVVFDFLVDAGIDRSRLKYAGYGEANPLVPNTSESNRRLNRRTEVVVLGNL